MTIDREQVRKIAHLARLEITSDEETQFTERLNSILQYFELLSELDTENIPPTTRAIETSNITRTDELKPFLEKNSLLQAAPEQQGDFFRVPQIMNSDEN
jgi:aspartyl-tRNA(Asn)/glutamyl-tRNA(Gln) amidotransferase subunit C